MRTNFYAGILLGLGLAGCGGGNDAITDPSKLTPLTAEHAAAIRAEDKQVEDEEGRNTPPPGTTTKGRRRKSGS